jgi:hypothetical protein
LTAELDDVVLDGDDQELPPRARDDLQKHLAKHPGLPADEVAGLTRALSLRWGIGKIKFSDQRCWGEPGSSCPETPSTLGLCARHWQLFNRIHTTRPAQPQRRHGVWDEILRRAAEIVESYDIRVTLRQLFYRLVSEEVLKNRKGDYDTLSTKTAEARRRDEFPALVEHGRSIRQLPHWSSPQSALDGLARSLTVDRTLSQDYTLVLGVEKNALSDLLSSWFGKLGVPIMPLGGYGSQTLEEDIRELAEEYREIAGEFDRPAVLIYAGDFDASGMNIGEKFIEYTEDVWDHTTRIGLSEEQIYELQLPVLPGKVKDPRAPKFVERYPEIHARAGFGLGKNREGRDAQIPVQVELDAVEPTTLHSWYKDAIDEWWDEDAYQAMLELEEKGRAQLTRWAQLMREGDVRGPRYRAKRR